MSRKIEKPPNGIISQLWLSETFGPEADVNRSIVKILTSQIPPQEFRVQFAQWQQVFRDIYAQDEVVHDLYVKHLILIFAQLTILTSTSWTLLSQIEKQKQIQTQSVQAHISSYFIQVVQDLALPEYFGWVFQVEAIQSLQHNLLSTMKGCRVCGEDLFGSLYQQLIANTTRHPKGEFYTTPALAELMVKEAYQLDDHVLDPACGSGTFLLAVANHIIHLESSKERQKAALQQLVGIDINPLACLMSRTNLQLFYLHHFPHQRFPNQIFCQNALFPPKPRSALFPQAHFDLVIGNPPWLVVNRIPSQQEKQRVKQLGNALGILRGGKLATSTELTTIFIYFALQTLLKPNGVIFVVTPASLATGSQHTLFRQFTGMTHIEFWAFDTDLFRIHSLCFKAQKGFEPFHTRGRVTWRTHKYHASSRAFLEQEVMEYLPSTIHYKKKSIPFDSHVPDNLDNSDNLDSLEIPIPDLFIGRLIPVSEHSHGDGIRDLKTLPTFFFRTDFSLYKGQFRQGASLVPRNLLFVDKENQKETTRSSSSSLTPDTAPVPIIPSASIQSKKYSTWEFQAFTQEVVEAQYLFPIAKSTGLLPFHYGWTYTAFLPLEQSSSQEEYQILPPSAPHANRHFQHLATLYEQHRKPGAKITSLVDRINYGKALTHPNQWQTPKVVYNAIGSIVKAALITEPIIIDTSLYFFIPRTLLEAYYLLGYLNCSLVTAHVKQVGSTGAGGSLRNIHKHPFNFALPLFDEADQLHQQIADLASQMEIDVKQFVHVFSHSAPGLKNKPKSLQLRLFKNGEYKKLLSQMDDLIRQLMSANAS